MGGSGTFSEDFCGSVLLNVFLSLTVQVLLWAMLFEAVFVFSAGFSGAGQLTWKYLISYKQYGHVL